MCFQHLSNFPGKVTADASGAPICTVPDITCISTPLTCSVTSTTDFYYLAGTYESFVNVKYWMSSLSKFPKFRAKKIHEIALPGSHHSGYIGSVNTLMDTLEKNTLGLFTRGQSISIT
jgi:hypothetical protein